MTGNFFIHTQQDSNHRPFDLEGNDNLTRPSGRLESKGSWVIFGLRAGAWVLFGLRQWQGQGFVLSAPSVAPWRNTLWSSEGVRKVFFFSELSRHFGRQRVVRILKLLAILPGRTTWWNKIDKFCKFFWRDFFFLCVQAVPRLLERDILNFFSLLRLHFTCYKHLKGIDWFVSK